MSNALKGFKEPTKSVGLAGIRLICNDDQTTKITSGTFAIDVKLVSQQKALKSLLGLESSKEPYSIWKWGLPSERCEGGFDGSKARIQEHQVAV